MFSAIPVANDPQLLELGERTARFEWYLESATPVFLGEREGQNLGHTFKVVLSWDDGGRTRKRHICKGILGEWMRERTYSMYWLGIPYTRWSMFFDKSMWLISWMFDTFHSPFGPQKCHEQLPTADTSRQVSTAPLSSSPDCGEKTADRHNVRTVGPWGTERQGSASIPGIVRRVPKMRIKKSMPRSRMKLHIEKNAFDHVIICVCCQFSLFISLGGGKHSTVS